jgi:predicted ATP-dependent endonuclease of OLD family
MRLKSFHVRLFRNVIDSGPIKVEGNTCLVGKNEAGKSALISALHRLNPAKPVPLALLDEYPRWLKKEHEISGEIKEATPITATYELEEGEASEIEGKFGKGVLTSRLVTVSRKYVDAEFAISAPIDYRFFVNQFLSQHVTEIIRPKLAHAATSSILIELLDQLTKEVTANNEPTPEAQAAKQARTKLTEILGKSSNLRVAIDSIIKPLVPRTFYFSTYSQLLGRYELNHVLPALTSPTDDEEIQAAADLLKLARISPENVQSNDFEASNSELEAISSLLTKRVKATWKQNEHLRLSVKIEAVPERNTTVKYLQLRVEDTRHDFSSRLDRRSTGFQWFVSFIASFLEFEKDANLILLLDEPGLSLHARAQMDLLDAVDTYLTGGRQVIYTTHSPFMVRTARLDRVRIVEDQGPEKGSIVLNDAGVCSDPDTLFPLQAALGYDVAHNLFIGDRNILLEGVSDFIYLNVLSAHLNAAGRAYLPENARLLPVGGVSSIPTFLALLGQQLEVVVLLDGDSPRQKVDNAIAAKRLEAKRVLSVDKFSTVKGADIEDLFTPDEYLEMFNAAFSKKLKKKDVSGDDRIVKRIARKHGEFDHGRVAGYFLANQTEILPRLSKETVDRFDALIRALGSALPAG